MPLSPAARRHRADLAQLSSLAEGDLQVIFRDVSDAVRIREELSDVLPQLMRLYGSAAASLAADWYDDLRERAEVRGRFQAIVAELPDKARTDALAGWSVAPLFGAEPDGKTALSKVSGGLQRIIFNADRFTITRSSVQDPRARGWQREGGGECAFCQMLLGRGAVYTEESSQFESHDRCKCIGVPAFE